MRTQKLRVLIAKFGEGYFYQVDLAGERNFILPIPSVMRR